MEKRSNKLRTCKKRRVPPKRLAWPGGIGAEQGTSFIPTHKADPGDVRSENHIIGFKKSAFPDTDTFIKNIKRVPSGHERSNVNEMWVDKHKPTISKSLCVAPKKIKEVKEWLQQQPSMLPVSNKVCRTDRPHNAKLLILVGKPGIGKSTMIHVLCNNLNLSVLEWNDHYSGEHLSQGSIRNGKLTMDYKNQLTMFEEFLVSTSFQYNPISISTASQKKPRYSVASRLNGEKQNGSIVLIDELPYLHTKNAERLFRDMINRYFQKTQTPCVFIFSNASEGKHKPEDLERLFDKQILASPFAKVLTINPVTKTKMKTIVKDIIKKERLHIRNLPDVYVEEIYLKSGGDIRHAIMNMQFYFGSGQLTKHLSLDKVLKSTQRDENLSTFHALGKLLYAKRMDSTKTKKNTFETRNEKDYHGCEWNRDLRPPLQFDPERVIENGGIDIFGAISFIQFNSPDFFSDIAELSTAFEIFSDSAVLSCPSFTGDYANSLCSRAVADTNKHAATSKFRQLKAPKIFETMRRKRENNNKLDQLRKRLSSRCHYISLDTNILSSTQFTTQELPFIKNILPEEINMENNLYCNSNYFVLDKNYESDENNQHPSVGLEEQNIVLSRDDIIESSSDESETLHKTLRASRNASISHQIPRTKISLSQSDVIIIE